MAPFGCLVAPGSIFKSVPCFWAFISPPGKTNFGWRLCLLVAAGHELSQKKNEPKRTKIDYFMAFRIQLPVLSAQILFVSVLVAFFGPPPHQIKFWSFAKLFVLSPSHHGSDHPGQQKIEIRWIPLATQALQGLGLTAGLEGWRMLPLLLF